MVIGACADVKAPGFLVEHPGAGDFARRNFGVHLNPLRLDAADGKLEDEMGRDLARPGSDSRRACSSPNRQKMRICFV